MMYMIRIDNHIKNFRPHLYSPCVENGVTQTFSRNSWNPHVTPISIAGACREGCKCCGPYADLFHSRFHKRFQ